MHIVTRAELDNDVTRMDFLARQLSSGRITLVLGAGVSASLGLPNWDDFVAALCKEAGITPTPGMDVRRQAEVVRLSRWRDDYLGFVTVLHRILYGAREFSFSELHQQPLISALAALVMNSVRGNAAAVLTLNFDDLLERYLEFHGFVVESIAEATDWRNVVDVSVLHPNGLIPFDPTGRPSASLLLDQASFMDNIGNDSKPWRQLILSLIRRHTCLFIGVSGNDDYWDSIIQNVSKTHASVRSRHEYWGLWFNPTPGARGALWNERGVYPVEMEHDRLPSYLYRICQQAALQRASR